MTSHKKKTRLTMSLITGVIAIIEFFILQIFIYFNILPPGGVNASLSMLLTALTYFIVSGVFIYNNNPRKAMWVAIAAFIFLCIFLFYSKSIIDIITFAVMFIGAMNSMITLDKMIKEKESKEDSDGRSN